MSSPKNEPSRELPTRASRLDEHGHELPDPRPMVMPAGFRRPETLAEQVQRLVRTSISRQAAEQGFETFEESEDFEVGEDDDPTSPYETFFDPVLGRDLSPAEFRANEQRYRERYLAAQRDYFRTMDQAEVIRRRPTGPARPREDQEPPTARGAGVSPAHARKATQEPPEPQE